MNVELRTKNAELLILLLLLGGCRGVETADAPVSAEYVGGGTCVSCHAQEAAAWTGSDHDRAMEPATPETVLGDFSGATFTQYGVTTRFFRRGDDFFVETEGPTGAVDTFAIQYTFGYRPLQQYLAAFPGGRLQALTIAWDVERQAWFSLYPDERIPPHDWLHWTKGAMTWNYMCADCHSTDLQKNYDFASDTYNTTWTDVDVNCEACHGPGQAHLEWARAAGDGPYDEADPKGLTARLVAQQEQIDTCAPCHSRRQVLAPNFTPGDAYYDHYVPALLEDDLYFPDGQIKDEVYVYGSFLQSKMYQRGVRCTDCHDPHSTRPVLEGNALCGRCHSPATYDAPEHHFHEPGTQAAQCVSCHMPERTYMIVDPRRDHSFRVPRPDLTVATGAPNACNGCHTDRSAAWARDQVVTWYGPERATDPHFALAFAAGRRGEAGAEQALIDVVENDSMPAIVRATALSILDGYATPRARQTTGAALQDPAPLVRRTAVTNLQRLPPEEVDRLAAFLVSDSVRMVRTEAARVLALTGRFHPEALPQTDRASAFRSALAEYRQSQEAVAEQAAAHLNLGVLEEHTGTPESAEQAYLTALRLDSTFVPAYLNLAMLYNRQHLEARDRGLEERARRLRAGAERLLRRAVRIRPDFTDAHYMLGLLLAEEEQRLEEAVEHLSAAARLDPAQARIQYNTGLAYQHLQRADEAERYLLAAHRLEPQQPDYLNALSILYTQRENWNEALRYTEQLTTLVPGAPALLERLAYLRQQVEKDQ